MSDQDLTPEESAVLILDEAENLIWALLDDEIDEASTKKLAAMLDQNESVRRRYIECVQLHVDLQDHFAEVAESGAGRRGTPILPNLMPGAMPGAGNPVND